ncbi:MAG: MgtC/SapB family protein [Myxococcota bacterium]
MHEYEPYISLALALAAGLLIGLEREQSRPVTETRRGFPGGIRTFPIIALAGGVAVMLSKQVGPWALVVAGLGLSALLVVVHWRDEQSGHPGLTSEAAAIVTFLLGALALADQAIVQVERRIFVVASVAVVTTMLLSTKAQLREFSTRVSKDDVIATLKFLVVAVVMLPILPDAPYGPYGALNPYRIGFMVLLIAAIGFVGYVAMRLWGHGKGLLVTGAVGGLVSSTAVTLASAARAKQTPELAGLAGLAVVLASTIMFARVLVTTFIVERSLFLALLPPLAAMGGTGLVLSAVLYFRQKKEEGPATTVQLTNPFELTQALKFGAFFVAILVVSRWATDTFGESGSYVTGALAGLTDVDAITLSMANLVKGGALDVKVAERTVVLATCSNTLVKGGLSLVLGGTLFGKKVLAVFGVVLAIGLVTMLLV